MREMDFSEGNLRNRWLGVNSIWHLIQGEVKQYVKGTLERVMREEVSLISACRCFLTVVFSVALLAAILAIHKPQPLAAAQPAA